jgi:hypothetical protein
MYFNYENKNTEIIFHEFPGTPWLLRDTGFCGYSKLFLHLTEFNYSVSTNYNNLSALINLISNKSIIILPPFKYFQYYPYEIIAIKKWIKAGGKILILAEHEDVYKCSSLQHNHLICQNKIFISNPILLKDNSPWFILPFNDKKFAEFYAVSSINSTHSKGTSIFLSDPDNNDTILACGVSFGKGKIAILCDSENIFNGSKNFGINRLNNLDLFIKIIKWLKNTKNSDKHYVKKKSFLKNLGYFNFSHKKYFFQDNKNSQEITAPSNAKKKPIIWFCNLKGSLKADTSLDGVQSFFNKLTTNFKVIISPEIPENFECALFINPLCKKIPDNILKAITHKKVILIGDAYSKIDNVSSNGRLLTKLGFKDPQDYPINSIAKKRGFLFTNNTLYDLNNNFSGYESNPAALLYSNYSKEKEIKLYLKKSGTLNAHNKAIFFLVSMSSSFSSNVSTGLDERFPFSENMNKNTYDITDEKIENIGKEEYYKNQKNKVIKKKENLFKYPYIIGCYDNKTLCLSDATLITNQMFRFKSNRSIINEIIYWLMK